METLLDSTRYNITTTQYALLPKINIIFIWTSNLFFMQLVKWCIHVFNFFAHLWKRYIIRYSWKWTRGRRCSAKERWSIRCHFYGPYHAYYGKYHILSPLLYSTLVFSGPFVIFTICLDQENRVALHRTQLDAPAVVSLFSSYFRDEYLFNFVFMMLHLDFIFTATMINARC